MSINFNLRFPLQEEQPRVKGHDRSEVGITKFVRGRQDAIQTIFPPAILESQWQQQIALAPVVGSSATRSMERYSH